MKAITMLPSPLSLLILLSTTTTTTVSAQRLRHPRDVGLNYGIGPLQFSQEMTNDYRATASATVTLAASEASAKSAVDAVLEGAYGSFTGEFEDSLFFVRNWGRDGGFEQMCSVMGWPWKMEALAMHGIP